MHGKRCALRQAEEVEASFGIEAPKVTWRSIFISSCFLDIMGEILEGVIHSRLLPFIQFVGKISERQYRFRRTRSVVDMVCRSVFGRRCPLTCGARW